MAIDTSYLYFRAFYGMPASVRDAQGNPVNAVRGVLDSLANLIRQHSPDLLACAWDEDWRPAWRTELIPSYKAHRVANRDTEGKDSEEVPQELAVQVPVIKDVLASLGLPVMGVAGYEADDVLASLAARHEGTTLVVTGDRDLFQLIDPTTSVVNLAGSGGASNLARAVRPVSGSAGQVRRPGRLARRSLRWPSGRQGRGRQDCRPLDRGI